MSEHKGNRKNVLDRWYGDGNGTRNYQSMRKPFKGEPQFSFDDLYVMPFTHELTADDMGRKGYTPLEQNLCPTGIKVLDEYIQFLHSGQADVSAFCAKYNLKTSDLDGFIFVLTGLSNWVFRKQWIMRCADELLRYTDMNLNKIASRCGAGTRNNLYFMYERDMNCSPTQRREELRQKGDLGRYKIRSSD